MRFLNANLIFLLSTRIITSANAFLISIHSNDVLRKPLECSVKLRMAAAGSGSSGIDAEKKVPTKNDFTPVDPL